MVFKIDSDHVEMMHDLCLYLTDLWNHDCDHAEMRTRHLEFDNFVIKSSVTHQSYLSFV